MALAIILFDSGFGTKLSAFRQAALPAIVLATVGVVLTTVLVGVAARLVLGFPWLQSFLLGAVVSSTDAAAVFFLLRVGGIHLRDRVRSVLEVESGGNDPMAIFLTVTLVELITVGAPEAGLTLTFAIAFVREMGLGLMLGLAGGFAIVRLVNRLDLESGLYPIVVLAASLVLFGIAGALHCSGFLAVYVAGLYRREPAAAAGAGAPPLPGRHDLARADRHVRGLRPASPRRRSFRSIAAAGHRARRLPHLRRAAGRGLALPLAVPLPARGDRPSSPGWACAAPSRCCSASCR